jgi:hypothetical protein
MMVPVLFMALYCRTDHWAFPHSSGFHPAKYGEHNLVVIIGPAKAREPHVRMLIKQDSITPSKTDE